MPSKVDFTDFFDSSKSADARGAFSVLIATLCLLVRDGALPSVVELSSGVPLSLRGGSRGAGVKLYQRALLAAGGELPGFGVDGDFGPETAKASDKTTGRVEPSAESWASLFGGHTGVRLIYTGGTLTLERFIVAPDGSKLVKRSRDFDEVQLAQILRSALLDLAPPPVA